MSSFLKSLVFLGATCLGVPSIQAKAAGTALPPGLVVDLSAGRTTGPVHAGQPALPTGERFVLFVGADARTPQLVVAAGALPEPGERLFSLPPSRALAELLTVSGLYLQTEKDVWEIDLPEVSASTAAPGSLSVVDTSLSGATLGTGLYVLDGGARVEGYVIGGVEKRPVPCHEPVITGISPTTGGIGTIVTVTGSGFPADPDEMCVLFGDGGAIVGMMRAQTSSPNQFTAEITGVKPGASNGQMMMGIGSYDYYMPSSASLAGEPQLDLDAPGAWIWSGVDGSTAVVSDLDFDFVLPAPPPPSGGCTNVWGDLESSGNLEILLANMADCPPGASIFLQVDAESTQQTCYFDYQADLSNNGGLPIPALQCALQLCTTFQLAFLAQGKFVSCFVSQAGSDITISVLPPLFEQWIYATAYLELCK